MEPTVQSNSSSALEITGIPQGIPTGVFIPNNQMPSQTQVQTSEQNTSVQSVTSTEQVVAAQPVQSSSTASLGSGALEKFFMGLARFIAKLLGQPDPITGAPNVSSGGNTSSTIVDKVWNTANKVIEKTADVASKATNVVTQATEKIQEIVPPPSATQQSVISTQEQVPVTPVVEQQNHSQSQTPLVQ